MVLCKAAGCTRTESQKNQNSEFLDVQGGILDDFLLIPLAWPNCSLVKEKKDSVTNLLTEKLFCSIR